ncbi:MAG: CDP-glucose 4,6-dehydratase [Bacteroidales bacterium]
MENMGISGLFGGIYKGKKVLLTGHTGFKGSWLLYWLTSMGAEVKGISLEPATDPAHIVLLEMPHTSEILTINDREKLEEAVVSFNPDIIFHLAAQALVRASYEDPAATFMTNVMGTVNILDISRKLKDLKAIVVVTSDKCYDNKEWIWGYRENDPMGGKDPYSASKGCAELVTAAYRHSFFNTRDYSEKHQVLLASARAGNVIGGGDWAADRIVPDIVRAVTSGETLFLRYPNATRPWQHVLEPLSAYLMLGWKLLEGKKEFAEAWNFGPDIHNNMSVRELVQEAALLWPALKYEVRAGDFPHEAGYLMLDSAKAKKLLEWNTIWDFPQTIQYTINWYREYYENNSVQTDHDLMWFIEDARKKALPWT